MFEYQLSSYGDFNGLIEEFLFHLPQEWGFYGRLVCVRSCGPSLVREVEVFFEGWRENLSLFGPWLILT